MSAKKRVALAILTRRGIKLNYSRTNRTIPQVTPRLSPSLCCSPSLCLYCSVPSRALSQLAAEWMDGGRGRSGEVNEIPMRCQGVLALRRGEWEKAAWREGEWLDCECVSCRCGIVDTPCLPARSPPAVLVFAKSAQDSRGVYRRGGEEGKEGRMTYSGRTKENRKAERRVKHEG